jgi:phage shock protein A
MGLFSRMKDGIKSRANAAIDKAMDPEKEIELAIAELEAQRKKALEELVSYKANAKLLERDIEKHEAKAAEWEKRAMLAVKAGDDEAARTALREKKSCLVEAEKVKKDRDEAAGYAAQLNKSRKVFDTKLASLKLRKGTLATQIAAARSGGADAFGGDASVWDRFQEAEDRIDAQAIESEVDAALRGEAADADFDRSLSRAAGGADRLLAASGEVGGGDALAELKAKVARDAADKAERRKALADGAPAGGDRSEKPGPGHGSGRGEDGA